MIETTIINWLKSKSISSVGNSVYAETPKAKKSNYIVIEKTGTTERDNGIITSAMVAIQSRSTESLNKAATINEAVKTNMKLLAEESSVFDVSLNSDYNFTDPTTEEYRYQAVFNITF